MNFPKKKTIDVNKIDSNKFKNSKFYKLSRDNRFILLSFFTSIGIMLLIMYCYNMVPFGDVTILRMDLYHQYGPLFAELYDRLTGSGGLVYSWESGGGGSFLGNFYNYLSSPFSLLTVLFGHINITEAITFLIMLKAAFSAAAFTYYFKASTEFKKHNAITAGFGILYAFSGYFVAYYWNLMWLDGMVLLPLIVLGIERIINGKSSKTYIISLAILMFASYYMAYMVCLFAVLYALCYYFGKYSFSSRIKEVDITKAETPMQKFSALRLPKAVGKFIGSSALAAGIAAFALLPTLFALKSCSATSGTFPSEVSTYFNIFDFIANHLASLAPTIRSSGEDVLPNIYCGVGTLMLAFLYLYVKSVPLKEKVSRAILLIAIALSFDLNFLNYIWHGFHFPNDLPYRFSFVYSFILLTIAFKALLKIRELTGRDLLNIGIGMSIFIILVDEIGSKNVEKDTVIISLIFVVLYTIVLSLLNNKKFQATAVASLLFCCMFAEIAVADTNNFDIDQTKTAYTSDYNNFRLLKDRLDEKEGSTYYRMELTDLRTRMDPSWYNYNGMSTFSSMAYEKSANLQYNLGMFGNYINSYTYHLQTPVYNSMFALKYIVNNTTEVNPNTELYTAKLKSDKFTAYENNYYLPIAYCVNSAVKNWDTSLASPFDIQADYFEKATGVKNVFTQVPITDISYNNIQDFGDSFNSGTYAYYKQTPDESASFTLTVTPDRTQNIYVYLRSDNVDQITVRAADDSFNINQDTSEEYILDIGKLEAGKTFYIDVPVTDSNSGYIDVYIAGLNEDVFKAGYSTLNGSGAMKVSNFTDTKIEGTVTASEDCLLYTSINYDESWRVFVDGTEVDSKDIVDIGDSLLGINLKAGTHEVTFKYSAQGLSLGIFISLISLIIFTLVSFIIPIQKKKKEKLILSPTQPQSSSTEQELH